MNLEARNADVEAKNQELEREIADLRAQMDQKKGPGPQ